MQATQPNPHRRKRQSGLKSEEELEQERQARARAKKFVCDTSRLAVVYGRQSSEKQTRKNRESRSIQTKDLPKIAHDEHHFPESRILSIIENELDKYGNKLDKPRSASGRIDMHHRPGMRKLIELIEADKVGAVFVVSVSRLFRDEDMINPPQFAKLCREHHTVVITTDDGEFDFNATAKDDLKDFLEAAQYAADMLKWQRKTLLRGKDRKGTRGGYAGHRVPTGLMLDDERYHYIPNPYWCDIVAKITRRYRALHGDLTALHNEVRSAAIFPDIPEEIKARIGHIALRKVPGGYTIAGRGSLIHLLTNPANIGHMHYDGKIVAWNAHPAIVDKEDFFYALERLRDVDLEGKPIDRPERAKRYSQNGKKQEGLLAGVRENGRVMAESSQGHVYVFNNTTDGKAYYTIKDMKALNDSGYRGAILVDTIDTFMAERVQERLEEIFSTADRDIEKSRASIEPLHPLSEGAYDLIDRVIALEEQKKATALEIVQYIQTLRLQVQSDLGKITKTIDSIDKQIAQNKREYDVAKDVMSDKDIREHFASLARLRNRRADLEAAQERAKKSDADIGTTLSHFARAREEWAKWPLESRRNFLKVITDSITIDSLTDTFLRVIIVWNPVFSLGHQVEKVLFMRRSGSGSRWTEEELQALHDYYPHLPKLERRSSNQAAS